MLNFTLLGTGALQPLPDRYLAAAMLTCMGRQILFDCGEGTQAAIRKAGMGLPRIDMIALTHYHGDHVYGLPGLWQSMAMAGRTQPLYVTGPEGLEGALLPFRMLCPALPFEIRSMSLPPEGLTIGRFLGGWPEEARLFAFPTEHHGGGQGYLFELRRAGRFQPEKALALNLPKSLWKVLQHGENVEYQGRTIHPADVLGEARKGLSVAYTGDTAYFPRLSQYVMNVDLLVCEATYGDPEHTAIAAERTHMTYAQAARTALDAGAAELWLTHYSPMIDDPTIFLSHATEIFPRTVCGGDSMNRVLCFEERGPVA